MDMRDTKVINFYRYKNSFTVENFQAYVQVERIPTLVSSFNNDQVMANCASSLAIPLFTGF